MIVQRLREEVVEVIPGVDDINMNLDIEETSRGGCSETREPLGMSQVVRENSDPNKH